MAGPARLDWANDGADWPNRAASRFVSAGGVAWHVQMAGTGPVLLLLHGTGAATHSWRGVFADLARDFTVIAPDLPGHGFSSRPDGTAMSLAGMARAVADLLGHLGLTVEIVVGHSAGAAIAARMCLDGLITPRALISLNGALLPLPLLPEEVFGPMARALVSCRLVPRVFAWQAGSQAAMQRLVRSTGSVLDAEGLALYSRLARNPGHVEGALAMMANWGLRGLEADLLKLKPNLTLITGSRDRTVPPGESYRVLRLLPAAKVISLPGLGHLAHEEDPTTASRLIREAAAS
jgi:magnesium chelatase accessory protein